jgi:hypothetical protein
LELNDVGFVTAAGPSIESSFHGPALSQKYSPPLVDTCYTPHPLKNNGGWEAVRELDDSGKRQPGGSEGCKIILCGMGSSCRPGKHHFENFKKSSKIWSIHPRPKYNFPFYK